MLCVRVAPSLRRRLKLVAIQSGRPIQELVTESLELLCKKEDM
jgi:predicted HicB family RNase H-like nuclease